MVVIAILGIKTGFENFKSSLSERSNDTAVIASWNERLSKLIAPIPFERGVVGYISNEDIPGSSFDADDTSGEYVLTQYAVAPLILVRGTGQEWNILNLDPASYEKWIRANANNFEFIEFGGGMYLVHKVNP